MEKNSSLSSPLKRITVLDALRGFALLGVILIHMIQHFGIRSMPSENGILEYPALDNVIQWIGRNIIMGRFINIFAFLFGLSFFIQMDRAAKKGIDFRLRFVWRMLILLFMGLLSHSFFNLEIISIYAFFGLLMLPLNQLKNWVLLLIIAFLLVGGPRIIRAVNHNSQLKIEQVEQEEEINRERPPREIPEHIANPSFRNSVKHNYEARLQSKLNYQFGYIGRGFVTFALFVLGLVIGRIRFFEKLEEHKKRNTRYFFVFTLAFILCTLLQNMLPEANTRMLFRPEGQHISFLLLLVKALEDINLVLSSGALALGFILLHQSSKFGKYLEVLSPYGRMGLTNYLMQGVIGAILFYTWAFGSTFGNWGVSAIFFLGIIIYVIQVICSKIWLKYFLYGPLEWLWRSLTYFKSQPFLKKQNS